MSRTVQPLWRGRALAFTGIVLFAFSLRAAVASFAPVIDLIDQDFTLPAVVIGLTGTVPPVCYAIFGLLTPRLERRLGLERLAALTMVLVALGVVARSLAVDVTTLLLSTVLMFAALGVANILLPPLCKQYFPDRIGLIMTIYTTTIGASTFIPPLIVVPVAEASSWRVSLAMWAAFAIGATIPWVALLVRQRIASGDAEIEVLSPLVFSRLWRLPMAWALTVGFVVPCALAYIAFTWLPRILVDLTGVSNSGAGALLALFAVVSLPTSLLVPMLVVRFGRTRTLYVISVAGGISGIAGLILAPTLAPWLWVLLLGVGGLTWPLTFVLLAVRTRTHEATVALSAFVQSLGYAIAAVFPLGVGLLHDATGSWTAPLLVLAGLFTCAIPAGVVAARTQTIEGQWERRHGPW